MPCVGRGYMPSAAWPDTDKVQLQQSSSSLWGGAPIVYFGLVPMHRDNQVAESVLWVIMRSSLRQIYSVFSKTIRACDAASF